MYILLITLQFGSFYALKIVFLNFKINIVVENRPVYLLWRNLSNFFIFIICENNLLSLIEEFGGWPWWLIIFLSPSFLAIVLNLWVLRFHCTIEKATAFGWQMEDITRWSRSGSWTPFNKGGICWGKGKLLANVHSLQKPFNTKPNQIQTRILLTLKRFKQRWQLDNK